MINEQARSGFLVIACLFKFFSFLYLATEVICIEVTNGYK